MIFEVLKILTDEVNQNFKGLEMEDSEVVLNNVALIDSQQDVATELQNKVILSMINLREEVTMKNFPNNVLEGTKVTYKNPKLNINLFLIFCANRTGYKKSLSDLSRILEFFQHKSVFTQSNTSFDRDLEEMENVKNFRFTMELFTPTFEELNYIWGTLGGRQYPSVFYKLNLIVIDRDATTSEEGVITNIHRNYETL
ncbi:DUF4255 domain-containing protein [Algoriphagus machipongonensis]|uniref:Pvc16 N-terminal domain-containing protein n=1 Tax=Algoriphagus machipongonensis TaxID=388413 RepID=A3HTC4_9BACT|nr:DUF4255 domain-containing protein [Algoriphagus machipongonensis]7ADZ_0A Chain 0A, cap protein (Algo1) [Algoriphagus machipongonensis]7ADZ_0B Chain 0B, cap protein (Algo1) [Algoriphagus machipongonensis]7ADZ_0C Chain 0C, cap protein (Algo1) [Algoriphagus machipongonensis]7ADZ_0D Chain 0D, cap protein (Algo1) [Algoriphagus machipongonensis]7ADZ_0E Chain 0E, cap protein (Algo1) [Algoriphagus machipongonensis]7ADZ_0F Chain 0F, cap protein (Algo1) [Algoriphagus machipongonensis]EAZ83092.1 hyp